MIEIKINKSGSLEIKRGLEFKTQYCPFDGSDDPAKCGGHCPLFGEPIYSIEKTKNEDDQSIKVIEKVRLPLCRKTYGLQRKYFKDERDHGKEKE